MPVSTTPNLQAVTTVGAVTNRATTFQGGLFSDPVTGGGITSFDFGRGNDVRNANSGAVGQNNNLRNATGNVYGFGADINEIGVTGAGFASGLNITLLNSNAASASLGYGYSLTVGDFFSAGGVFESFVGANSQFIAGESAGVGNNVNVGVGATSDADTPFYISVVASNLDIGISTSNIAVLGGGTAVVAAGISNVIQAGFGNTSNHRDSILIGNSLTTVSNNDCAFGGGASLYRFLGTFPNANTLNFGNPALGALSADGTNFLINPQVSGSGYLFIGDGTNRFDLRARTIGLGDSVPGFATNTLVKMDSVSATIGGGLSGTIEHTGTTATLRAMLFESVHSGSPTTGGKTAVGGNFTATLHSSTTGAVNMFGVNVLSRATVAVTQGTNNFQNKFDVQSSGTSNTGGTVFAKCLWATNPGTFAGGATVVGWSGLFSGDLQVNSDMKLILEGSDTVKGDSYLSFISAANEIRAFVNGTQNISIGASTLGFFGATASARLAAFGEVTGFTAGVSTAVLKDSTFTGNVGATAVTISDIVKAMKNYGLLPA